MRTYNLVMGIALVVAGVAMIGGAAFVPVAAIGLVAGGLACIGSGAFCIWWSRITKGTIMDRPLGYGMNVGFAQMAAGTASANAMLSGMVASNTGAMGAAPAGMSSGMPAGYGPTVAAAPGVPARARVEQTIDHGPAGPGLRTVDVQLTVSRRGAEPYTATVRQALSPAAQGQLVPGADIAVTVDPLQPHQVHLALAA